LIWSEEKRGSGLVIIKRGRRGGYEHPREKKGSGKIFIWNEVEIFLLLTLVEENPVNRRRKEKMASYSIPGDLNHQTPMRKERGGGEGETGICPS